MKNFTGFKYYDSSLSPKNSTVMKDIHVALGNYSMNETQDVYSIAAHIEDVGYVYITPVICIIGFIFNILNLLVLYRLKGSSYVYLSALAVADGLYLFLLIPIGFSRCQTCLHDDSAHLRLILETFIMLPVSNIFCSWSVWITVALTMERYILTRHPIHGRNVQRNIGIAKKIIVLTGIVSVIFNLPYFFQSSVVENRKVPTHFSTTCYYMAYGWSKAVFIRYLPIVMLATLNILLIRIVKQLDKKRNRMSCSNTTKKEVAQRRLTVTLIVIVFIFLIGNIPISFAHRAVYRVLAGDESLTTLSYKVFRLVANLLELISFGSNFILYCILNKRFMETLLNLFSRKAKEKASSDSDKNTSREEPTEPYTSNVTSLIDENKSRVLIPLMTSSKTIQNK